MTGAGGSEPKNEGWPSRRSALIAFTGQHIAFPHWLVNCLPSLVGTLLSFFGRHIACISLVGTLFFSAPTLGASAMAQNSWETGGQDFSTTDALELDWLCLVEQCRLWAINDSGKGIKRRQCCRMGRRWPKGGPVGALGCSGVACLQLTSITFPRSCYR